MAAIPTILKGDTPAAIPIALAEGFDYAEATLHVRYMGVEKVFTGLVAGGSLSLQFTEEETSRFPVGAAQVGMWLVHPGGRIRTIPTDNVRIKVTDSASEVYNAQITLRPSTLPPDATDADTLGDLKAKYNALKATIAAGCAALCVLVSSAAGISGGNLNDIPGNAMVVTNVTFEGLARLSDLPPLTNGLARTSDIPSTAADVGALPITGGTLRPGKVDSGKGTELSICGSYGKYEPEEFIPEGGSVEIKGGDSDQGGVIEIFGGYGNGGNLKIYPPNAGASYGSYGIEILPEPNGVGNGFIKINGTNVMDAIAAVDSKVENAVLQTNQAFSNAVLAVGLNIDTNSVAVLNDIAETFGGFPIEGTATTVGGLLAALAAAIAWLKKNKVGSFASVGGASATVENGVAKLESFFTESNSLLNGRLTYSRNATGLKDRAFNTLLFDGTEFNLSTALEAVTPTASGQPRDLLIVATATAATTIGYTAGTIKGDKPTIDGSGTWLITLTEYASGVWYCRQIKMEDAA